MDEKGITFTLSTVSRLPDRRSCPTIKRPMWFQLYVLRDRGFMRNALERAKAAGCSTLVFAVDMLTSAHAIRDAHSGMAANAAMRRYWRSDPSRSGHGDVGLNGRHMVGRQQPPPTSASRPAVEDYIGWLANNFDPRFLGKT